MTAIQMHFFRELYAELRASWWRVTPKAFWWRQTEARQKSTHCGNMLMKQVLVMMSKTVTLQNRYKINGTFSRKLLLPVMLF